MQKKLTTLDKALDVIEPGTSVALGGATLRRKPMALAREVVRRGIRDLEVWSWVGSLDVDLLIATGCVRKVNSAYVGFGAFGLAGASRRAFASGEVEFVDWTESSLVASFRAGAADLPMALTRALLGTSMADELGVQVELPYGGPPTMAVPAARPDVALIHAQIADEFGNVRRKRPWVVDDIDHVIAASARKVIVSVEEIEPFDATLDNRDETVIPGHLVSAVCVAPQGAHPTTCDGYYDPDPAAIRRYAEASASPEGIAAYVEEFVAGGHDAYVARLEEAYA
jgi:glutaconate CoA-transferase, subunit A